MSLCYKTNPELAQIYDYLPGSILYLGIYKSSVGPRHYLFWLILDINMTACTGLGAT